MSDPWFLQCLSECFKEEGENFGIQNGDINGVGDEDEEMEDPEANPEGDPFDEGLPVANITPPPPLDGVPLFPGDDGFTDGDGMVIECFCYDEDGNVVPVEEEPELIDERPIVIIDYSPEDDPPDENVDIGEENPNQNSGMLIGEEDVQEIPPLEDPREPPEEPVVAPPPIMPIFPTGPLDVM